MTSVARCDVDTPYRSMFHGAPEAMIIVDPQRVILDANDAFCRLFQYCAKDVIGRQTRFLYESDGDYAAIEIMRAAAVANQDVPTVRTRMVRADGGSFTAQVVGGSTRDANDSRLAFFCTIRDVSDQHSREVRLTAEREMLRQLYYRTPALLHSIDREGRILHVSDEWLAHFGYSRDEVIGQYWRSFLTDTSRRFSVVVVGPKFWRTGLCSRVPFEIVARDGRVHEVELSAVVSQVEGRDVSLSVCEDVTARNSAMRSTNQQNAALRDFAAFASHDLQSPLRHIQLFSDQLEDSGGDPAEVGAIAVRIREKAALAQEMVRSLLDFSRAAYGGFETRDVPLEQAVALAARMVEREIAESGASLEYAGLPVVRGDLHLIARVFQNLFANAIKHGRSPDPNIRVSVETVGSKVTVRVADNGVGMPLPVSDRAFAAYEGPSGGKGYKSGGGLGLSICRQIVHSHGGNIWVDRQCRAGTEIRFTLTAATEKHPVFD